MRIRNVTLWLCVLPITGSSCYWALFWRDAMRCSFGKTIAAVRVGGILGVAFAWTQYRPLLAGGDWAGARGSCGVRPIVDARS